MANRRGGGSEAVAPVCLTAAFSIPGLQAPHMQASSVAAPASPPPKASSSIANSTSAPAPARSLPKRNKQWLSDSISLAIGSSSSPSRASQRVRSSSSPSLRKTKRCKVGYDDPSASKYAHLTDGVPDHLGDRLDLLLCGINPGVESARTQRHYAHPSNHFYKALSMSGLTSRLYTPSEDHVFPTMSPFRIGLTNLVGRPTSQATELGDAELLAGAPVLLGHVERCKPLVTGFVGKGISQAFTKAVLAYQPRQSSRGGGKQSSGNEIVTVRVPRGTPLAWRLATNKEEGYGLLQHCLLVPRRRGEPTAGITSSDVLQLHDEHGKWCAQQDAHAHDVALFWSGPSTSARVTSLQLAGKARWFERLRRLVTFLKTEQARTSPSPLPPHNGGLGNNTDGPGASRDADANTYDVLMSVDLIPIRLEQVHRDHVKFHQGLADPSGNG
ncbi:DNA glycosylase [Tilletiaria anomala UBC 951]|uniref:DNA glycosylase n=1 Tax=Tilletiaria anomala (strain ATCC 24038 / CBS 436.72 / UBC 951) TaxID=1037660 RepID=A0A066VCU4_TILAU|nr:DNA glycosylase [Tilletiaria anomala UBC 951]KDN36594.1 DNA glycosylase [Tilletiaria anomala UBC 951]